MVFPRRGLACPQMSFAVLVFLLAFAAEWPLEGWPSFTPIATCSHSAVQVRGLGRALLSGTQITTTLALSYTVIHGVRCSSEGEVPYQPQHPLGAR